MGFPPEAVGYLRYCADLTLGDLLPRADQVIGNVAPAALARTFAPHPEHLAQRSWPRADAADLLARGVGTGR